MLSKVKSYFKIDYNYYKTYPNRSLFLDTLRGSAIILMIIFHFCFDLNYFQFITIDIYNVDGDFWKIFRYIIVTIFLVCVGIGLQIVHRDKISWRKVKNRFFTLSFFALLISLVTIVIFPNSWIYFGIIHFIALSSILGLFFVNRPLVAFIVAIANLVVYNIELIGQRWMFYPIEGFLPSFSEDLVPLTPWFSLVLFGIIAGYYKLYKIKIVNNKLSNLLAHLGRYSLVIYMIHQPLLFGLVMIIYNLIK